MRAFPTVPAALSVPHAGAPLIGSQTPERHAMSPEPDLVPRVLALLQRYGWEEGYKNLRAELRASGRRSQDAEEFFLGWMAAERGTHEEALRHFDAVAQVPALRGWARAGAAFVALRQKDFRQAHALLDEAGVSADPGDELLGATRLHLRGAVAFHEGRSEEALPLLLEALGVFGTGHFGTGRVLDTLGMLYAGKNNFHAARLFYQRAIDCKRRFGDQSGEALSEGQLGRLYQDWGDRQKAEEHFRRDLEIVQRIGDDRSQAQLCNFLGQLALARGEAEVAGQPALARRHWNDAAGFLDTGIRRCQGRDWAVIEGYLRKDRALLCLAQGDVAEAEGQAAQAEALFRRVEYAEGLAHLNRVWGVIRRRRGQWDEALRCLREALNHFVGANETAEVARTQLEIARTRRAAGEATPLVSDALVQALRTAESCRRADLIQQIEQELQAVDHSVHAAHLYQRVRGRAVREDATSLIEGRREPLTVLYLDLKGSTEYALESDAEEVMLTINQMMADFAAVLRRHDAQVSAFRGDGFLALVRGQGHAFRAVAAGLDLDEALAAFNRPRRALGLPLFTARIGISTGEVFLGNVGTYDKMDYTALGTPANLGARLEGIAEPGYPCISRQTYEAVRGRARYREGSPRTVSLKGLGEQQVWDVAGRAGA
jgi:class 3 adenylate cyclase